MLTSRFGARLRNSNGNQHVRLFQPRRALPPDEPEKGALEKSFTADTTADAKETQTLTLSWPWANPRVWDVGQPNLYTLRLKVTGSRLDDEYDQRFGFREFWVEGRKLFLNGTEIHLRQPCFYYGPRMQVGDNF